MKIAWVEDCGRWYLQRATAGVTLNPNGGWHWFVFDANDVRYLSGDCPTVEAAQADAIAALERLEGEA